MKLKDFNIVYINLKRRPDRKDFLEKKLNNLNLHYKRIDAIDAKKFNDKEKEFYLSRKNFNVLDKNRSNLW